MEEDGKVFLKLSARYLRYGKTCVKIAQETKTERMFFI